MKKQKNEKTKKVTAADKIKALSEQIHDMNMEIARKEHALPIKVAAGIDSGLAQCERDFMHLVSIIMDPMPWYWSKAKKVAELEKRAGMVQEQIPSMAQTLQDEIMRCIATEDADESSY